MDRPIKSLYKAKSGQSWSFFCPLCRATRKINCQPKPGARHFAQIALTTAALTLAAWPIFGMKGLVAFVPLWGVFELVYRSRVRVSLNCPHCGFDPYLYLVDIQRARTEIESHWRKKFEEKGIPFPERHRPSAIDLEKGDEIPASRFPHSARPNGGLTEIDPGS